MKLNKLPVGTQAHGSQVHPRVGWGGEGTAPPFSLGTAIMFPCVTVTSCVYSAAGRHLDCLKRKGKSLSRVRLFVAPWTVAYHAAPSMGFSGQEYWSGVPFPSPGDLPDLGIEPGSAAL